MRQEMGTGSGMGLGPGIGTEPGMEMGLVYYRLPTPPVISQPSPENNGPPSLNLRERGGILLAATLNT